MGTVYLIHFEQALAHAKHYTGFTKGNSPLPRLATHRANEGAAILKELNRLGIKYHVVRIWRFSNRTFERSLKDRKNICRECPICNPKKKKTRYSRHKA